MKASLEAVTAVLATDGTGEAQFVAFLIAVAVVVAIIFSGVKKGKEQSRQWNRVLSVPDEELARIRAGARQAEITAQVSPEHVAEMAAERIGAVFSAAHFAELFGEETFPAGWSLSDALGVWYSLGNLALVIAVWSVSDWDQRKRFRIIDHGRLALIKQCGISGSTRDRLMTFINETEGSAIASYKRWVDSYRNKSEKYSPIFFTRYVSCILGNPVEFSQREYLEDILKGVHYGPGKMALDTAVCGMLGTAVSEPLELFRKTPINWDVPVPTNAADAE
jgi:hypothetical protein